MNIIVWTFFLNKGKSAKINIAKSFFFYITFAKMM